jgi:hypothetical protein
MFPVESRQAGQTISYWLFFSKTATSFNKAAMFPDSYLGKHSVFVRCELSRNVQPAAAEVAPTTAELAPATAEVAPATADMIQRSRLMEGGRIRDISEVDESVWV